MSILLFYKSGSVRHQATNLSNPLQSPQQSACSIPEEGGGGGAGGEAGEAEAEEEEGEEVDIQCRSQSSTNLVTIASSI